jgi:hypothetical protein
MKQRYNAPWAYGGYRALQKLTSERGPAPKYVPPPEPKMQVEDVIEEVHHVAANTGRTDIVCVLVHPEDYHELLSGMNSMRYQIPPDRPFFSENPGLPPTGPSSMFQVMAITTGVGQVDIRMDSHINKGSIVVVTK